MTPVENKRPSTLYDLVLYRSVLVQNASPNHLRLCGGWNGASFSATKNFQYAELGCGDGGNLLPIAFYHPESTFIGVDNSTAAIEKAQARADTLGLRNISFVLSDLRTVQGSAIGPCDFVVSHGVYSWIPQDARDAMLQLCRDLLKPNGLAYISYNAQPGWSTRRLVRETLLRASSVREAALEEKAANAIRVAAQLLEDLPSRDYAFAVVLAEELERAKQGQPHYVFHEYLAEENEGFWLRDFCDAAAQHNLQHVIDAQFCRWEGQLPAGLRTTLTARGLSPLEQEETADLLCNRYFRASILCRSDVLREGPHRQTFLRQWHIATSLRAESNPFDLRDGVVERFFRPDGPEVALGGALTKAAILMLARQWPRGMTLDELFENAKRLSKENGVSLTQRARDELERELITLCETGQVDLRPLEPPLAGRMPDYPRAHRLALLEAAKGGPFATPFHLPLTLDDKAMSFVAALEGSQSTRDLANHFGETFTSQTLETIFSWGLLDVNST